MGFLGALDRVSGGPFMSAFSLLLALLDRGLRVGFLLLARWVFGGWL
jgi:hypothetical protein